MNLQNIADVVLPIQRPYPKKIYILVYDHALYSKSNWNLTVVKKLKCHFDKTNAMDGRRKENKKNFIFLLMKRNIIK